MYISISPLLWSTQNFPSSAIIRSKTLFGSILTNNFSWRAFTKLKWLALLLMLYRERITLLSVFKCNVNKGFFFLISQLLYWENWIILKNSRVSCDLTQFIWKCNISCVMSLLYYVSIGLFCFVSFRMTTAIRIIILYSFSLRRTEICTVCTVLALNLWGTILSWTIERMWAWKGDVGLSAFTLYNALL